MDSYEVFFQKYCEFMKRYKDTTNQVELLADYTEYMTQYADTMTKLNEVDDGTLNNAELKYYTEVMLRINQEVAEAAL